MDSNSSTFTGGGGPIGDRPQKIEIQRFVLDRCRGLIPLVCDSFSVISYHLSLGLLTFDFRALAPISRSWLRNTQCLYMSLSIPVLICFFSRQHGPLNCNIHRPVGTLSRRSTSPVLSVTI